MSSTDNNDGGAGGGGGGGQPARTATAAAWAEARQASSNLAVLSALEELQTQASQQLKELEHQRQLRQDAEATLAKEQALVLDLQQKLHAQLQSYQQLETQVQAESSKAISIEASARDQNERNERLQAEADRLREEIRYVVCCEWKKIRLSIAVSSDFYTCLGAVVCWIVLMRNNLMASISLRVALRPSYQQL
jgi:chlorite dismutase